MKTEKTTLDNLEISKEDYQKILAQGKTKEMERLLDYALIKFKETKERQGIIKVKEEYAKVVNKEIPEIKKEEIKNVIENFFDKKDLAKKVLEVQPFYYDDNKFWWYWNYENSFWKITDETDILNIVGDVSLANTINSKDKAEILEALRQEARKKKPKAIKPTWIQFKGEIYDIKTGEQFKVTPEYFAVNPIPWELDKNCYENTPTIDKIFTEWVGKKYVKTLYEIIAYCLIPDYPLARYFILSGSGLNGKTTYINLLIKFLGKENVSASELDDLINSRFEGVKKLWKKLACVMGETDFSELHKTAIIKKATGRDLMGFEDKYKGSFQDYNYAKIIIATNNVPETSDKTVGFHRRPFIIDFPNEFSEKIDILDTIPEQEYQCLALKLCSILKDLLESREFTNEGTVEDRAKRYEDKSNPIGKFTKEFCDTKNPDSFIFVYDFAKRLNQFLKENRYRAFSDNSIAKKLKELGIERGRKTTDFLIDGETKYLRCWYGIRWIEPTEPT